MMGSAVRIRASAPEKSLQEPRFGGVLASRLGLSRSDGATGGATCDSESYWHDGPAGSGEPHDQGPEWRRSALSVEANLAAMRALQEAWGSHDLERIAQFFHDDFENHQTPFEPVIGLAAYLRHCAHWFAAYPDLRFELVSVFGQGDLVCLEQRTLGTSRSDFFGNQARRREEVVLSCDVFEFRDGKIARERGYWDFSVTTGKLAPQASLG
jgi:predicted ester cyclase